MLVKVTDYWHALFKLPHINLQMYFCCDWKPPLTFQLWTSAEKRLPAVLGWVAWFFSGLVSTTDLVGTTKLVSCVAEVKFQGRSLEMKIQAINPLHTLPLFYISTMLSQLYYLFYGMKEGHGCLQSGEWHTILFTMQNDFNYELIMLSFYEIIVPNVTHSIP